jgi:hypothetical protein
MIQIIKDLNFVTKLDRDRYNKDSNIQDWSTHKVFSMNKDRILYIDWIKLIKNNNGYAKKLISYLINKYRNGIQF